MKRNRKAHLLCAFGSMLLALATQIAWAQDLRPFTARYQARYHGVSGGFLILTLRKGSQPNQYVYESRAKPGFLASFLVSEAAREYSTMIVDEHGVRPLKFFSDDGKKSTEKDSNIQFDWEHNRLSGTSETVDMTGDLPQRLHDHMSVQVAVIWALQHDAELGEFLLVDGGEIKHFDYSKVGTATVDYKGRAIQTTVVKSARSNSTGGRVTRYWHAAEFGNIPLKAERARDGKVDLTMDLVDIQFTE